MQPSLPHRSHSDANSNNWSVVSLRYYCVLAKFYLYDYIANATGGIFGIAFFECYVIKDNLYKSIFSRDA